MKLLYDSYPIKNQQFLPDLQQKPVDPVTVADMENMTRSIYDHADRKAGIKVVRPRSTV